MNKVATFFKYNNLLPIALGVVFLGGGAALAAPQIGEMIGSPVTVEAGTLLSADIEDFNFSPTVTAIEETEDTYLVSYEITTLSPVGESWEMVVKTGQFTVAKSSLDDTGLQGKVVAKLRDIENAERIFLTRAQEAERSSVAATRPANIFSALIGRTPDDIYVPERERLPGELPEHIPEPSSEAPRENNGTSTKPVENMLLSETASSTATTTDSLATSSPSTPSESTDPTEPIPTPVLGCTDAEALNYDSSATEDDDTCEYEEVSAEEVIDLEESTAPTEPDEPTEPEVVEEPVIESAPQD